MNQSVLVAAAFATGVLVPLQLAFNGQLGQVTRNAYTASLIVFLVGAAVLALVVLATRPPLPSAAELLGAPKTVWLGGAIATLYILAVVWVTPRLGVATTAVLIISGQLVMAVALDHFGAFGTARSPVSALRAAGLALVIVGAVAIRKG
jgi:transporter family-2 protein